MTNKYLPPENTSELVLSWLNRCRESQFAHYEVASDYQKNNNKLGPPVIAINAVVSASIFSTFLKNDSTIIRFVALGLSLFAILLSSLHNYLKFSDKAEAHRAAAAEYAAIRRKLEILHATNTVQAQALEKLGKEISELAKKAPNISSERFAELKKRFPD